MFVQYLLLQTNVLLVILFTTEATQEVFTAANLLACISVLAQDKQK